MSVKWNNRKCKRSLNHSYKQGEIRVKTDTCWLQSEVNALQSTEGLVHAGGKAASGSNTDYLIKYGRFIKVDLVQKSLPNEKSITVPLMS